MIHLKPNEDYASLKILIQSCGDEYLTPATIEPTWEGLSIILSGRLGPGCGVITGQHINHYLMNTGQRYALEQYDYLIEAYKLGYKRSEHIAWLEDQYHNKQFSWQRSV